MKQKMKTKLRRDDQVKVIAGKEKGKTGRVLRIDRVKGRVLIEGVNLVKKAVRKRRENDRGGIIDVEAPVHISNVMLVTKSGEPTRLGYKLEDGKKTRIARKTGDEV
jgi:large subunit ribosomal protein L24